ncbi:equilibrative nucleobase transporter 1-like [Amphiura filiformis]|uniref:equilibrative nucleobase transporter 1-like n=1 Tax=Amphiura filiformis TaxID=82378 RepID=UPI003B21EC06
MAPCRYHVIFILAICEMLFFGGLFYGWPSLVYVLKEESYYFDLCVHNDTSRITESVVCDKQDANLNLVYTIGSTTAFLFLLPVGIVFDWFGTRLTRILSHFILVTGLLLMLMSSPATPYLLFPGMMCLVVGGTSLYITLIQIGNLFAKHRSTAAALISGSYDASAVVMLFIKLAYDAGVPLQTSFTILISCTVIVFIPTFYLLPNGKIPWPLPPNYKSSIHCDHREDDDTKESDLSVLSHEDANQKITEEDNRYAENPYDVEFPTIKSCLRSPSFILLMFWFCMQELRLSSYTGLFNPLTVEMTGGNRQLVDHYTKVFGFIQFGVILFSPLGGMILDRNKGKPNRQPYDDLKDSALGFATTSILFVLFAIFITIPIHRIQYATFILCGVSKAFLFGILFGILPVVFPFRYYGTLTGVIGLLGATVDLLQYPLYIMTQKYLNNNFLVMNIIMLIACAATIALPVYVTYHARRLNKKANTL